MPADERLSVPEYRPLPPRALTAAELSTLLAVADTLIPDGPAGRTPSRTPDYPRWLDRALAARRDAFDRVLALVAELGRLPRERLGAELRRLAGDPDSGFTELSTVVAGAYLLVPQVREAIGYPGQAHRPAPFDEAAEQIMDGILDPVIERGPIFRPVGAGQRPSDRDDRKDRP